MQARNMIFQLLFRVRLWKNLTTPALRGSLKDTTITKLFLYHGIIGGTSAIEIPDESRSKSYTTILNQERVENESIIDPKYYGILDWKPIGCHIKPKADFKSLRNDPSNLLILDEHLHRSWDNNEPTVTFYFPNENKLWKAGPYNPVKLGAIFQSPQMATHYAQYFRSPTQEGCTLTFTIQHQNPKALKTYLDWRHEQKQQEDETQT